MSSLRLPQLEAESVIRAVGGVTGEQFHAFFHVHLGKNFSRSCNYDKIREKCVCLKAYTVTMSTTGQYVMCKLPKSRCLLSKRFLASTTDSDLANIFSCILLKFGTFFTDDFFSVDNFVLITQA